MPFRTILAAAGVLAACLSPLAAQAAPERAAAAARPAADPRWGLYGTLAGGIWVSRISTGHTARIQYSWVDPGKILRAEHRMSGSPTVTIETITLGSAPGELSISTVESGRSDASTSTVRLNGPRSAVETYVGRRGSPVRATYSLIDENRYRAVSESQTDGVWRQFWSSEITRIPQGG